MGNYNKNLEKIVREVFEKHAQTGNWKQVKYEKRDNGSTSFMLFERVSAEQPYYFANK